MAYVPIPKDLNRVKTKVAFNLTRRQLIGFSVASLVGFPVYLSVRNFVPLTVLGLADTYKESIIDLERTCPEP